MSLFVNIKVLMKTKSTAWDIRTYTTSGNSSRRKRSFPFTLWTLDYLWCCNSESTCTESAHLSRIHSTWISHTRRFYCRIKRWISEPPLNLNFCASFERKNYLKTSFKSNIKSLITVLMLNPLIITCRSE